MGNLVYGPLMVFDITFYVSPYFNSSFDVCYIYLKLPPQYGK
jgi:hypothetical protein